MTAPSGAPEPVVPAAGTAALPAPAPAPLARPIGRAGGIDGDLAIALLLRSGTLVAGLLLVGGLVAAALSGRSLHAGGLPLGRLLRLEAEWPELLAGAGILALCLTPVIRVAATAGFFALGRERSAALVAAGVLALLAVGLVLGSH